MSTKSSILPTPTEEQFLALNQAFQYFNQVLFEGILPGCILNFSRKKNTHGFMAPKRWRRVKQEQDYSVHEISLTPVTLYREPVAVFSTLVHEQVHLWQWEFGTPSRGGYHNREWAQKMTELGLMPSSTGKPGGGQTGQHVSHYILPGGRYEQAFQAMPPGYALPFTSLDADIMRHRLSAKGSAKRSDQAPAVIQAVTPNRNKVKYTCPGCQANVWGKPNLNLICGDCGEGFQPL